MRQPMSGGKSNGETAKAVAAAKKAAATKKTSANKVGKSPRQVETSMSAKYRGTPKVSQATIDSIKKMGMTAALKKAGSSKNPEYLEGIKRMYGAKRLAAAKGGMSKPVAKKTARSVTKGDYAKETPKRSMRNVEGMKGTRKGIKKYF